jgi:hypothetical protein
MVNQMAFNERLQYVPKVFIDITNLGEHRKNVEFRWGIIVEIFHKGKISHVQLMKTFGLTDRELIFFLSPLIGKWIWKGKENGEEIYKPYEPGQHFINGLFKIIEKQFDDKMKRITDQIPERMMLMEPDSWL